MDPQNLNKEPNQSEENIEESHQYKAEEKNKSKDQAKMTQIPNRFKVSEKEDIHPTFQGFTRIEDAVNFITSHANELPNEDKKKLIDVLAKVPKSHN